MKDESKFIVYHLTGFPLLLNGFATEKCERITANAKVNAMESSSKYSQFVQTNPCVRSGTNIYHSETHKPHAGSSQGIHVQCIITVLANPACSRGVANIFHC